MNKLILGENDLATAFPDLLQEWCYEKNEIRPENIYYGSSKKIWWKCKNNHVWEATPYNRVNGTGCPYCKGKRPIIGTNDLFSLKPELCKEWDYEANKNLKPEDFLVNSNVKVWWKCKKGHQWKAEINRRSSGSGCPFCSGRRVIVGVNDLLTVNPELCREWDYEANKNVTPDKVKPGSNIKVWWKCNRGHSWESLICSRSKGHGCPYCSGKYSLSEFISLKTWCVQNKHENLLSEWNNNTLSLEKINYNSNQRVKWKCANGHEWEATVKSRINGSKCPYCSGRKPIIGKNDLLTMNPKLCEEWDYEANGNLIPESFLTGSEKKIWWKCKEGHKWQATIYLRNKGAGCPYCSGHRAIEGKTDIFSVNPELKNEWNYEKNKEINPLKVSAHSSLSVWWMCANGHEWKTRISNRTRGFGCPYCSGRYTVAGFNDLKTWCIKKHKIELLNEWDYNKNVILPENISPQNSKKVWWKCSLGHEWKATIGSRTGKQSCGCPYCSIPVKKILVGFNDFETKCKEDKKEYLLKEWNYERNGDITPQNITYSSGKKIWWKCEKGHEWATAPSGRVRGTMCPICSRTQTSFPEQAIAYYLSQKFKILQRYSIEGYEIDVFLEEYNIGIEYDGIRFHSLPKSAVREQKKDKFYLEKGITIIHLKEDISKNVIEGNNIYFVVKNKMYIDDTFSQTLNLLFEHINKLINCSYKYDIDVRRDELDIKEKYASYLANNSVAAVYPELVSEWDIEKNHGMTADLFSAAAHNKVWWKCKNGHSWQAVISSRSRKLGCPYCAGQRTIIGKNDFESWCKENNPGLLIEWNNEKNNIDPSEMMKTSNKKFWWKCANGHEWEATIANRVHGTRCPYCFTGNNNKRNQVSFRQWCLLSDNNILLEEWDFEKNTPFTPDDVSKASHKKVWWKCEKGHEWFAEIKSRTYNHGCPYCSGTYKKALIGVNDLVTWCKANDKQYILEEWDYENNDNLNPEMFTFGSHKRINWKCAKGHKWNAVIKERTKYKGNMCPECRNEN